MNKMFQNFTNKAAGKVWDYFEEFKFEDDGLGNVNKVCQFSDFVDELDNETLAAIAGVDCDFENGLFINLLRGTITRGINKWLEA
nr:MAG TPA: hypothetical protein [Caudoviricetes sp.]